MLRELHQSNLILWWPEVGMNSWIGYSTLLDPRWMRSRDAELYDKKMSFESQFAIVLLIFHFIIISRTKQRHFTPPFNHQETTGTIEYGPWSALRSIYFVWTKLYFRYKFWDSGISSYIKGDWEVLWKAIISFFGIEIFFLKELSTKLF